MTSEGIPKYLPDPPFGLIGDYRSVVDAVTEEFLSALDNHQPKGYWFDEKTSWHICRMNMEEKFMSIQQRNFHYHQGEIAKIRKTRCPTCECNTLGYCPMEEKDLERCWYLAEIKKYQDWAAPSWDFNEAGS